MGIVKNFTFVVVNLIGECWMGIGRKPEFYDKHTMTKSKSGYVLFVLLASLIALGTVKWLSIRLY